MESDGSDSSVTKKLTERRIIFLSGGEAQPKMGKLKGNLGYWIGFKCVKGRGSYNHASLGL